MRGRTTLKLIVFNHEGFHLFEYETSRVCESNKNIELVPSKRHYLMITVGVNQLGLPLVGHLNYSLIE